MRILFIPCRHPHSAWLLNALQQSGHSVQRAEDLPDGILLAAQEVFDAVVATALDPLAHSALIAGLSALASAAGPAAVVTIIRQSAPAERVRILHAGAAACLCLPFSFTELHERLHALHRPREAQRVQSQLAQHGLKLDMASHALSFDDICVAVTRHEGLLLECLIRHFNSPVPHNQLIRYVWPDAEYIAPSNVNLAVTRLRQKLAVGLPCVHIETVKRYGYQLTISREHQSTTFLRQPVDA
jgi:DNA-binding response OmpR family regulator